MVVGVEEDRGSTSRLRVLLEHFGRIEDPRDVRRVPHPLPEVLLPVVCGTMADCDDYESISARGEAHLPFLRRHLPYEHGVPSDRRLTILMNRVDPDLFSAAFTARVRATFPGRADFVVIDGETSRRSHDRRAGTGPIHPVSAFATTGRLVLAREAVPDKADELAAISVLLERPGADGGLAGALVSIDAIATNPTVAAAVRGEGADYLLAVKANQPTLRAEVEAAFAEAPPGRLDSRLDLDKGHGRVEERRVAVIREVDWLSGSEGRRFPGELRLPDVASIVRVETTAHPADRSRTDTRYFVSSAPSPPNAPPPPSGATGASRTACTGSSTSSSATTSRALGPDTAPRTWPSSGTSPSISSAPRKTAGPSRPDENSPDGPTTTSPHSST